MEGYGGGLISLLPRHFLKTTWKRFSVCWLCNKAQPLQNLKI